MIGKIKATLNKAYLMHKLRTFKKNCTIGNDVVIYRETKISNLTTDKKKILIGDESVINGMLILYPFGEKIDIGKNTYIGIGTRIWAMGKIEIGNNVLIAHNVNIIDNNSHSIESKIRKNELRYLINKGAPKENVFNIKKGDIKIGDNVWIGLNSIILKGVEIGENSIVAAGSVVTKNVPSNTMVAGNPARPIKEI
ncbi:acyltransferase [Sporolactobacillus sp. CQH2019]|uniref:acyltransferase n=1 Tax=Sporolactobacillus sp. CQH2019 TaxID=3023512 RepID=UPI002368CA31|nr:acyltransferase [Sporolactobacillus sp. CQH2019]MDD9148848.1 acyltransferase [Sporolactobacillus sp. CQH2019]